MKVNAGHPTRERQRIGDPLPLTAAPALVKVLRLVECPAATRARPLGEVDWLPWLVPFRLKAPFLRALKALVTRLYSLLGQSNAPIIIAAGFRSVGGAIARS